jgi:hypothetical protein
MAKTIEKQSALYGARMRPHVEAALRGGFTRSELEELVKGSGLERTKIVETDTPHLIVERSGESDPNSWITVREQYR